MTTQINKNKNRLLAVIGALTIAGGVYIGVDDPPTTEDSNQIALCDSDYFPKADIPNPCVGFPIIVYNSDGSNGRFVCFPYDIDAFRQQQTHSVTGGIGFGSDYDGLSLKSATKTNFGNRSNPFVNCLKFENNHAVIKGSFFIEVPCDSLTNVSTSENLAYTQGNIDDVEISLKIFENNYLLNTPSSIKLLSNDKMLDSHVITDFDYYGRCEQGQIVCKAIVAINAIVNIDPTNQFSPNSPYHPSSFCLVFIVNQRNGGLVEDIDHIDHDFIDVSSNSLSYFKSIDFDTSEHLSKHISTIDFNICNPNYYSLDPSIIDSLRNYSWNIPVESDTIRPS